MIRKSLIGALLLSLCVCAGAQGNVSFSTPASRETVLGSALWLGSGNSAGMALDSLVTMSGLSLKGNFTEGGLKSVWSGEKEGDIKVSTNGITRFNGLTLYGDFSYDYITQRNAEYNCILYEPSYDQPYFVADLVSSDWKKQAYDMGFRIASPVLINKHWVFGFEARYKNLVGAKQRDPRTETYRYDISVSPSAAFIFGNSAIGLSLSYLHSFERSKPSTENFKEDPRVAIMRGLGFYTLGTASPNTGIDIFYYKTNAGETGIQYSLKSDVADILVDAGVEYRKTIVSENVTVPKTHGRTEKTTFTLNAAANLGVQKNHRLRLDTEYGSTTGYECNQKFDTTPGVFKWITISEPAMSGYNVLDADANYIWYNGLDKNGDYRFKIGADAKLFYMTQDYYVPSSSFNASNIAASVLGGWNFPSGKRSSFLPGLRIGYRMSPSGEYSYRGTTNTDSQIISDMYPRELEFLTSDRLESEASLIWALKTKSGSSLCLSAQGGYDYSFSLKDHRIAASLGISLLF